VENGAGMHSLVDMVVEGEEDLDATVLQMADQTGATASFLSKDVQTLGVELRAEGTGAVRPPPDNSFVSIMDKMADTVLDGSFSGSVFFTMRKFEEIKKILIFNSAGGKEWGVLTKDLSLQPDNLYKSTIQVANYSSAELTLEVVADDLLQVSENVPKLAPFSTLVVFVSTKLSPPQDPVNLENGIIVSLFTPFRKHHYYFKKNIHSDYIKGVIRTVKILIFGC
jgi:hypothetical protein